MIESCNFYVLSIKFITNLALYSSFMVLSQFSEEHLIFQGRVIVQLKLIEPQKFHQRYISLDFRGVINTF